MEPYNLFPAYVLIGSYVAMVALIIYAGLDINWRRFYAQPSLQHFFLGSVVVISLLMTMQAGLLPGLEFHLMGYTAATLLMGWRLALLVGIFVELLALIFGVWELESFAYKYLINCALPVILSWNLFRLVERYFPKNPFIYIMLGAFLNAGFTHALADVAKGFHLVLLEVYSLEQVWREYLRYLPLIMFPEGVINGMFITGMVAFNPQWLSSFDEDVYFS